MGTQQILLIVLSVIVVGIAVAVGIQMFSTQAQNANRQAVMGDLQNYGASAVAHFKMPASMGGGGKGTPGFGADLAAAKTGVGRYMGFTAAGTLTNDNGTYTLGYTSASVITITGVGTEIGQDGANGVQAVLTVTGTASSPLSTSIAN